MSRNRRAIWEQLHLTPNKTSVELAELLGQEMSNVSSELTALFRREQVSRAKRTFINEAARQQTLWEYRAIGKAYHHVSHPVLVLAERGTRQVKRVEAPVTITAPIDVPAAIAAHVAAETPPVGRPAPAVVPLTEAEQFAAFLEFKALKKAGAI